MNKIKDSDSGNIRVADITLAQLSRGLYRSTATAFKELVANSYDADATKIRIDTNFPEFNFISCVDDGAGMHLKEFVRYFKDQGIGSCIKHKGNKYKTDKFGRPIIGRIGIGMLAIGQLCNSFKIESHYKDNQGKGHAYIAKIVLLDKFPFSDKEQVIHDSNLNQKELDVGTWQYDIIDYDKKRQGFRIYSTDIRSSFSREMKDALEWEITKKQLEKISFKQSDLHSRFYDKSRSIRECKAYLETIWELAILCPLPYYGKIEEYPINLSSFSANELQTEEFKKAYHFIIERQSRFLKYNFRVIFDGIELRQYKKFPTEKDLNSKLYFIYFDDKIADSRLRFSGYLFAQIPSQIKPRELNGIQIRLKGVGIGGYDSTFLKYYKEVETIRSRWVSGEIFVDEGLESALNIDRDSFNEHDEHYKKLQSEIHEKLDKVFNEINRIARTFSDEKGKSRDKKDIEELWEKIDLLIKNYSEGKFKLREQNLDKEDPIVIINDKKGEIVLNTTIQPLKSKKANTIFQYVELAYHIAGYLGKKRKNSHEIFFKFVKVMLDKLL
jgi:hypothetical protein